MRSLAGVILSVVLAGIIIAHQPPAFAQSKPPKPLAVIPPNKDTDLKFYSADGTSEQGTAALEHMMSDADLVLWVAGTSFSPWTR